jgi:hypothetical protein
VRRFEFFSLVLILQSFASPARAELSLGFTLVSYRKGDYTNYCKPELERAKSMGFTTVVICTSFSYDPQTNQLLTGTTVNPGEVEGCLNEAWNQGFNVVYEPHLESPATLAGNGEAEWRAHFDVHPDETFRKETLGEFHSWVAAHAKEIAGSQRQVELVPAAELERSTASYPGEWIDLIHESRRKLLDLGLESKIRIGLNLNWYPAYDPKGPACAEFSELIHESDFIAPSFYGDWSHTGQGEDQVIRRQSQVIEYMERRGAPWWTFRWLKFWDQPCPIDEIAFKPFGVGEISVGGVFFQSSMSVPIEGNTDLYVAKRRELYRNVLDWAKHQQTPAGGPLYLNIWTVGEFDPVGIRDGNTPYPDSMIADWIRQYAAH